MADVKLVKSIYTGGDVTSLGELAAADTVVIPCKVTNSAQPAFLAQAVEQANVTGDSTVYIPTFVTEIFDQGSNFVAATGIFTAPVTGRYQLSVIITFTGLAAGNTEGYVQLVMSNRSITLNDLNVGAIQIGGSCILNGSILVGMDTGDTAKVNVYVAGGAKIVTVHSASFFSGYLVC